MASYRNILNELKETAPAVANIVNNNPYTVPMGYFDSLASNIMKAIQQSTENSSNNPYSVPEGYFDGLSTNILAKIKKAEQIKPTETYAELEEIAPVLNTINKTNVFSVPEGYFNQFQVPIVKETKPAKVVAMGSNIRKWITYAAAASVIFILSASSYLYINNHMKGVDKSPTIGQRLAALDDQEIINYLESDLGDFDPNATSAAEEDPDLNQLFKNASDEEIERYLDAENNESGEDVIKGI